MTARPGQHSIADYLAAQERLLPLLFRRATFVLYRRSARYDEYCTRIGPEQAIVVPRIADAVKVFLWKMLPPGVLDELRLQALRRRLRRTSPRRCTTRFCSLASDVQRMARGRRVVAFDVFDTLLRRRIKPETVKDLAARHLAELLGGAGVSPDWKLIRETRRQLELELGQASEERGLDHEFRFEEMVPAWIQRCATGTVGPDMVPIIARHELDLEKAATWPTPGIIDALTQVSNTGIRLIFVTDNYHRLATIWDLLQHHDLGRFFAAGYCSSESFRTKRSGALFQEVLHREDLEPSELLVVGDNPYSDVDAPDRLGIATVHVRDNAERTRRLRLCRLEALSKSNRYWTGRLAREVIESGPARVPEPCTAEYQLGLTLAPAFIAFVLHIIEQARKHKLQRLFFLSREGLLFMRMYRRMVRALNLTGRLPPAVYLAASRAATFLPSMKCLDVTELHRMWRQYDRQSMNRLLRNLNLPPEAFLPLAARCGIRDFDEPIEDPLAHAPFQAFLADAEVRQRFLSHRDTARGLLMTYLRQKGFFRSPAIGMIDIGWKGTIQDNIIRAARDVGEYPECHGIYFALARFPGWDDVDTPKQGFMADFANDCFLERAVFDNGPAFEMFTTAPHGSVVGYQWARSDSPQVKPVIRGFETERLNHRRYFVHGFHAIEDYFREYLKVATLVSSSPDDWKPHILDQLRRYILYPTRTEARSFLKYSHVESFGVHGVSTYEFKGSWRQILAGGAPWGAPGRLVETVRRQFWRESVMKRSRIPLANFVYDLLKTRRACET